MTGFYPRSEDYFVSAQTLTARPIFQGDVFAGAPGARLPFPLTTELLAAVRLKAQYALLLPHPCDFAGGEKGDTQIQRLVAPVIRASETKIGVKQLRSGQVGHLFWLPRWSSQAGEEDWVADLRLIISLDAAFFSPANRCAALSVGAWIALNDIALNDKVATYFTGMHLDRIRFAI